jgi:hypothetical protein
MKLREREGAKSAKEARRSGKDFYCASGRFIAIFAPVVTEVTTPRRPVFRNPFFALFAPSRSLPLLTE